MENYLYFSGLDYDEMSDVIQIQQFLELSHKPLFFKDFFKKNYLSWITIAALGLGFHYIFPYRDQSRRVFSALSTPIATTMVSHDGLVSLNNNNMVSDNLIYCSSDLNYLNDLNVTKQAIYDRTVEQANNSNQKNGISSELSSEKKPGGFRKILKNVKLNCIIVSGVEFPILSTNQFQNQQDLNQQRLAKEIEIITNLTEKYSEAVLFKAIENRSLGEQRLEQTKLNCETDVQTCRDNISGVRREIAQLPDRLHGLTPFQQNVYQGQQCRLFAREARNGWNSGIVACERTLKVQDRLYDLINDTLNLSKIQHRNTKHQNEAIKSRVKFFNAPTNESMHQGFEKAITGIGFRNLEESESADQGFVNPFKIFYSLHDSTISSVPEIRRFHTGDFPQLVYLGVNLREQAGLNPDEIVQTLNRLSDSSLQTRLQMSLDSAGIHQVLPGQNPIPITLETELGLIPIQIWSESSSQKIPTEIRTELNPLGAVVLDQMNGNKSFNIRLKTFVALRAKVDTVIPHTYLTVQNNFLNTNHKSFFWKETTFAGFSVDLFGVSGIKKPDRVIAEVNLQTSFSKPFRNNTLSFNVGLELF